MSPKSQMGINNQGSGQEIKIVIEIEKGTHNYRDNRKEIEGKRYKKAVVWSNGQTTHCVWKI